MFNLPFSQREFLELFSTYNQAIWPAQIIAYMLGAIVVGMALWPGRLTSKTIVAILAAFWIWTGGAYHIAYFGTINSAAYLFGALFIVEGILLIWAGFRQDRLKFQFNFNTYGVTGALMIAYAMIIYPIIGYELGHGYPSAPMFGVAPCPMVIFTFGILLWAAPRVPGWLLVIPGLWSIIGFTAATKLGMLEDTGLLVAGILGITMLRLKAKSETLNHMKVSS